MVLLLLLDVTLFCDEADRYVTVNKFHITMHFLLIVMWSFHNNECNFGSKAELIGQ